jgi:hypothetical protein
MDDTLDDFATPRLHAHTAFAQVSPDAWVALHEAAEPLYLALLRLIETYTANHPGLSPLSVMHAVDMTQRYLERDFLDDHP